MKQGLFILLVLISFQGFSQNLKISKCYNLEVMETDLGKMNYDEAKKACAELGDGWRLPTIDELGFLYYRLNAQFNSEESYWSSTNWTRWDFYIGVPEVSLSDEIYSVRAVRELK
jgi:hypothetical protein